MRKLRNMREEIVELVKEIFHYLVSDSEACASRKVGPLGRYNAKADGSAKPLQIV